MIITQFYLSANSVYLVIYTTLCTTLGQWSVHPLGEDTLLVHSIEVYPYNCLDLGLKWSGCSYMYQIVPLLPALFVYMYELQLALYLIILRVSPTDDIMGILQWCHQGWGIPSPTVISFGTNSNTLFFIWFNPYSETFFCFFSYMYWFPIGWTSKFHIFQDHSGNTI